MRGQIASLGDGGFVMLQIVDGDARALHLNQIIELEAWGDVRSLDANAFYHLLVTFCLPSYKKQDPSWTHDRLHAYFRDEIIGVDYVFKWKVYRVAPSTAKLGRRAFCEFVEAVMDKAVEDVNAPIGVFQAEYEAWKAGHPVKKQRKMA